MRVMYLVTRFTCLAAVLLAIPLSAAEIFVANNGNDITGDGSISNPYKTIQTGILAGTHGDVVWLRAGTYTGPGNVNVNYWGRNLVVSAYIFFGNIESVTIDCGGSPNRAFVFENGETNSAWLQHVTIKNGDVRNRVINFIADKSGGAIKIKSSPTIFDVVIENCRAQTGGAILMSGGSVITPLIDQCVFRNDSSNASNVGDGGAIIVVVNGQPVIKDCLFHGNYSSGVGGAVAISSLSGNDVEFTDCIFYENAAVDWGSAVSTFSLTSLTGCTFAFNDNNIFGGAALGVGNLGEVTLTRSAIAFNETSGIQVFTNATITFDCNDFWQNTGGSIAGIIDSTAVDANTIFEDPLFCDTANADFTIDSSSPCASDSSPCGLQIGALGVACNNFCCIIRGDVNHDGLGPDIADLIFLIDHLFINLPPIPCREEGNIDNDPNGDVDIADLTFLIDHLFINFPPLDPCD